MCIPIRTPPISSPASAFASMLSDLGEEDKALEIISSVDQAFENCHLAAGEYLFSVSEDGKAIHAPTEICKDTPRFAPYPRYKCYWEFIVKLAGLKVFRDKLVFTPMKNVDFYLRDVVLAGVKVNITVQKDWDDILVNGISVEKATIKRDGTTAEVRFVKRI